MASTTTSIQLTAEDLRVLDEASDILGAESRVDAILLMAHTVVAASRPKAPKQATKKTAAKASQKTPIRATKKHPPGKKAPRSRAAGAKATTKKRKNAPTKT
jgi:hypothetical protein